jgi:hypothetical protein
MWIILYLSTCTWHSCGISYSQSKDSITLEFTEFTTEFLLHRYPCEQNEWNVSYVSSIPHALDTAILNRSKDLERTFLQCCSWGTHYSGTWLCVNGQMVSNTARQHSSLIFKGQMSKTDNLSLEDGHGPWQWTRERRKSLRYGMDR